MTHTEDPDGGEAMVREVLSLSESLVDIGCNPVEILQEGLRRAMQGLAPIARAGAPRKTAAAASASLWLSLRTLDKVLPRLRAEPHTFTVEKLAEAWEEAALAPLRLYGEAIRRAARVFEAPESEWHEAAKAVDEVLAKIPRPRIERPATRYAREYREALEIALAAAAKGRGYRSTWKLFQDAGVIPRDLTVRLAKKRDARSGSVWARSLERLRHAEARWKRGN